MAHLLEVKVRNLFIIRCVGLVCVATGSCCQLLSRIIPFSHSVAMAKKGAKKAKAAKPAKKAAKK